MPSAWFMTVTGSNPSPASFDGAAAPGTAVTLDPGAYSVDASGPAGYSSTVSADCAGTIAAGETKTCTITNDDQPATLIVTKHVINDNGGGAEASDFTLDSGGTDDSPDDFAGAEAPGTTVTLDAGSYNVTESGPSGYTASFSTDCSGTIALGETQDLHHHQRRRAACRADVRRQGGDDRRPARPDRDPRHSGSTT